MMMFARRLFWSTMLTMSMAGWAFAQPFQPCPYITIGWALSFQPPITSVLYDTSSMLLYVIFNATTATAYSNVPISVIQGFSRAGVNPVSYYNSSVYMKYHPLMLAGQNNCPLLADNGAYEWAQ
jgi:KTSC domain